MKKAQMTVFIIIGLVLLIATLLVLYFVSLNSRGVLTPALEDVDVEFREVQTFVVDCIRQTGEQAFILLGEHGGYIDPRDSTISGVNLDLSPQAIQSDVVYVNPEYMVPYWWHLESPNDCSDCVVSSENIPTIESIQNQVNRYIDRNLAACLNNFEDFKKMGIVMTEPGIIETLTTVTRDDIQLYVNYPLEMEIGSKDTMIEHFPVKIDLPFLDIYTLALAVTTSEQNDQYLETITMQLISAYSDVDEYKLPPIVSFDEGFDVVTWSKTVTMQRMTDLLSSYISFIQVENTRGFTRLDSGELDMYRPFILENNLTYPDTSIDFAYLGWPIHFDITPRSGELLKPSSHLRTFPFGIASPIQTNHYEFFYDVGFPVLVELRDYSALSGIGYSLVFALEGNIMDNKNLALWHIGEGTYGPLDQSKITYSFGESLANNPVTVYVPETDSYVELEFEPAPKKLFCDDNQRLSGEIEVEIIDSKTLKPLEDTDIIFGCGKYASCNMGTTDEKGTYRGRFPVCVGEGFIALVKDGYAPKTRSALTITPDDARDIRIKMDPLRIINAHTRSIPMDDVHGYLSVAQIREMKNDASELLESEQAIISVNKVKEDPFEPDYSQVLMLTGDKEGTIKLAEGRYHVQASLIDLEGYIIPEHDERHGGQSITVPEIDMKPAPLGGAIIDDYNGAWIINQRHLEDEDLIFYLFKASTPTTMSELEKINQYENHSYEYRSLINPVFD